MRFFSPIRPLLKGWALSFLGWGLVAFVMAAQGVLTRGDSWGEMIRPGVRDWLIWALVTPLLFRLVMRLPIDRQHWKVAVPVHLLCGAMVIVACHSWKQFLQHGDRPGPEGSLPRGLRSLEPRDEAPPFSSQERRGPGGPGGPGALRRGVRSGPGDGPPPLPPEFRGGDRGGPPRPPPGEGIFDMLHFMSFELPIYLMIMTGAHAALFFRRDQERAARLAQARLEALRMQLQPHFLFNTLNTIAGLVHDEPDKADAMLVGLSDLLRLTLDSSSELELPLNREMQFVQRYLEIMHARFEKNLRFTIEITPEVRTALVPTFLLQPLIENAVEHGLQPKASGGVISVKAWREGDALHLSVADNGVGVRREALQYEGIGLGNTRARLHELYAGRASLTLINHSGCCVVITLPFHTDPGVAMV